jgi:hypothetical protein
MKIRESKKDPKGSKRSMRSLREKVAFLSAVGKLRGQMKEK